MKDNTDKVAANFLAGLALLLVFSMLWHAFTEPEEAVPVISEPCIEFDSEPDIEIWTAPVIIQPVTTKGTWL